MSDIDIDRQHQIAIRRADGTLVWTNIVSNRNWPVEATAAWVRARQIEQRIILDTESLTAGDYLITDIASDGSVLLAEEVTIV